MLNDLTPLERDFIESVYQKIIGGFERLGSKTGFVRMAYSHNTGSIITVRSNDNRYDRLSEDPNYEIIATYSGLPRPRLERVAGDILAHFESKEAETTRPQPAVQ